MGVTPISGWDMCVQPNLCIRLESLVRVGGEMLSTDNCLMRRCKKSLQNDTVWCLFTANILCGMIQVTLGTVRKQSNKEQTWRFQPGFNAQHLRRWCIAGLNHQMDGQCKTDDKLSHKADVHCLFVKSVKGPASAFWSSSLIGSKVGVLMSWINQTTKTLIEVIT